MAAPLKPADLHTPVQYLKGVGPQRAELLAKLDLNTALDVLFFFPRDYQDMSHLARIADLQEDQPVSIEGTIDEVDLQNTGTGRCLLGVLLRQENEFLRAVWFNQPYMREKFAVGQRVLFSGQAKLRGLRWEMAHPRVEWLGEEDDISRGRVLPVYPLTEGINQSQMRRVVQQTVEKFSPLLDDVFPAEYLKEFHLWTIHQALREIHTPANLESLEQARRRFIFQELLVLQLALALRKRSLTTDRQAAPLPVSNQIDERIRRLLPFQLTPGQEQAVREIAADLAHDYPMNRMLQGDVGSGKTIVAVYAMLAAVANKHQTALMAPTEILAQQHIQTLEKLLAGSQVRMALLVGSLTAAQRRDLLAAIAAGEIDLVIGTHAIVQEGVEFSRLGLVVIDEQHKFGVRQRAQLRQHGLDPHCLIMTATPIPRTVCMSLYGDLDVTTLRDAPPGRQTVHTYLGDAAQRAKWWEFFREKLRQGRQGYVITPLVEQSSDVDVASVQHAFENLANGELADFRLDLVHGRLSSTEKQAAMDAFHLGETQVLVATSVVEVGVDVPNATLMTIEDGHRFGLAQLHQMRGRVSRGDHPGYVCVFAETENDAARRRLNAFVETTDGFRLAEIDFSQRGPGDLLGTRQHGLPPLRIADLARDQAELEQARTAAQALAEDSARWESAEFSRLRRQVLARYEKALELGDVG